MDGDLEIEGDGRLGPEREAPRYATRPRRLACAPVLAGGSSLPSAKEMLGKGPASLAATAPARTSLPQRPLRWALDQPLAGGGEPPAASSRRRSSTTRSERGSRPSRRIGRREQYSMDGFEQSRRASLPASPRPPAPAPAPAPAMPARAPGLPARAPLLASAAAPLAPTAAAGGGGGAGGVPSRAPGLASLPTPAPAAPAFVPSASLPRDAQPPQAAPAATPAGGPSAGASRVGGVGGGGVMGGGGGESARCLRPRRCRCRRPARWFRRSSTRRR